MVGVEAGESADSVGTEEFVLIEHARKNPAKPFRIYERGNAPFRVPQVALSSGMNACAQFGHVFQAFL